MKKYNMPYAKKLVTICLIALGITVYLYSRFHLISGKKVLNDLRPETITKVTLEKTVYDGEDEVTVLEPFLLNESELELFYQTLSKATLKNIHSNFFRYNTNIKYYMIFADAEDVPWGYLKFFEDEFFTIDRAYADDTPSVHKLYRVHSSSFKTFFSSVCETRQQKLHITNNRMEKVQKSTNNTY